MTVVIFSASSLVKSKPKCSSMARTSSTPSSESKPSSSKVAVRASFEWSHFAADLRISKILASTSSIISFSESFSLSYYENYLIEMLLFMNTPAGLMKAILLTLVNILTLAGLMIELINAL